MSSSELLCLLPNAGARPLCSFSLIGIGAPTHIFLPEVAKALGTDCIIPEHAEVANAIGAIIADISAKVDVKIAANYNPGGIENYTIFTNNGNKIYETLEETIEEAKKIAIELATNEAKKRGALGELSIKIKVIPKIGYAKEGVAIDLGTTVTAIVSGRIEG